MVAPFRVAAKTGAVTDPAPPAEPPAEPPARRPLKSLDEYVSRPPGLWGRRVAQHPGQSPLDEPRRNVDIDEVPPQVATAVLDLAMRLGELLVASGTPANDTVVMLLRLTRAYGMKTVYIDVNYTSITTSYHRGWDREPITTTRVVQNPATVYTMVERAEHLLHTIENTPLSIPEATERFRKIMSAPRPYPLWVNMVGTSLVGVGAVLLWNGDWAQMLATFLIGLVTWLLIHAMGRLAIPPFFSQVTGATLIAVAASGLWWVGEQVPWFTAGRNPDLLMTGGIIMLVVGNMAVGAAQDAIDEFYVTAGARMIEVIMLTGGILAGLVLGIQLGHWAGIVPPVTTNFLDYGAPWAQLVGAFVVAAMYGIETNSSWKTVGLSGIAGLAGWAVYMVLHAVGWADVTANAGGGLAAALVAVPLCREFRAPVVAVVSSSLIPLVPGTMLVNSLKIMFGYELDLAQSLPGLVTFAEAVAIAVAIGVGATAGIIIGRPATEQMRRLRRLRLRPPPLKLSWLFRTPRG